MTDTEFLRNNTLQQATINKMISQSTLALVSGIQACVLGEASIHTGRGKALSSWNFNCQKDGTVGHWNTSAANPHLQQRCWQPTAPTDTSTRSPALPENTAHPSGSLLVLTSGNCTEEQWFFWMKARKQPKCQQLCEIYNFMLCWTPWLPLEHFSFAKIIY